MGKAMFVTATDTGVGKTIMSAMILDTLLEGGYDACYFKPICSGANDDYSDFAFVKNYAKADERRITQLYNFEAPVSPHLASKLESMPIEVEAILERFSKLTNEHEHVIVEGCGGLAVPINYDGYMISDLILQLRTKCLLVSPTKLGTINHTFLTVDYARRKRINISGIVFNYHNGQCFEEDNITTLAKLLSVPVVGVLPAQEFECENELFVKMKEMQKGLNVAKLMKVFEKA